MPCNGASSRLNLICFLIFRLPENYSNGNLHDPRTTPPILPTTILPPPRRAYPRPRARQSYRRTHRLQRRLRAALRHRLRHPRRHRPQRQPQRARVCRRLQRARRIFARRAHRPIRKTMGKLHSRRDLGISRTRFQAARRRGYHRQRQRAAGRGVKLVRRVGSGHRQGVATRFQAAFGRNRNRQNRAIRRKPLCWLQLRHYGPAHQRARRSGARRVD